MDKETKNYIDNKFDELMAIIKSAPVHASSACGSDEAQDPFANWQDKDIYPVWKDDSKPHTLDNLDGIHVPVIDGTEILVYPKYKNCQLLSRDKRDEWKTESQNNPLYVTIDQQAATDELLSLGSEAAEHARHYGKDMPLPIQLLAIARYQEKIDTISKMLGGDILSDSGSDWWACLRYNASCAWFVYGDSGAFDGNLMYGRYQSVPVSLYKKS